MNVLRNLLVVVCLCLEACGGGGEGDKTQDSHLVRKSIPTFAMGNPGSTVPATGMPLYRLTISADPAGAIEWSKLTFGVTATKGTMLSNLYLVDHDAPSVNLLDTTSSQLTTVGSGTASGVATTLYTITINLLGNSVQPQYAQIAAGQTKTYDLYGTVSGFSTGSTLTIALSPDTSPVTSASAAVIAANPIAGNVVWSDRSSAVHTITSSDWTNGYGLKDFTNAIGYSKQ
ncbi:MAG: hypothetical protein ACHQU0_00805 [Candidatus Paceibacteria bacterium]